MKRIFVLPLAVFLLLMIQGCSSGGPNSSGSTNVTIAVGSAAKASPSRAPGAAAPAFASIRFTISAADIADPIVRTVAYTGSGTVQESFLIPNGADRHFLVELLDADGNVLYSGEATASLLGSPVHLDITLAQVAQGSLSGIVRDAVSGQPLSGVSVEVLLQGSVVATGTTGGDGSYLIPVSSGSGYTLRYTLTGFLTVTYEGVVVESVGTTTLEAVLQIDNSHLGAGNVSGRVVNSLTVQGVNGLTINLRAGINATSGSIVATTSTSSIGGVVGSYAFSSLPAGNYTGEVSGTGYITGYFTILCVGDATTPNQNTNVTPVLPSGETRIVLTWGATPSDLDSHLTGPTTGGSRFHVYFGNSTYSEGGTSYADLDVDDTSSFGPETTTIHVQITGVYRFSVHNWSNSGQSGSTVLSNSGAQVRVYRSSGLVATFNVPLGQTGTLWTVFEMNGNTITPVNTLSLDPGYQNIQGPARGVSAATDAALLKDLPAKP